MLMLFTKTLLLLFTLGHTLQKEVPAFDPSMQSVKQVPLPEGFERVETGGNLFQQYLRNLPLRRNKVIYLYNGLPKSDQSAHYAVIDVSTGERDLQQCADAIMRLRSEYFYQRKLYDSIRFQKNNKSVYQFSSFVKKYPQREREGFMKFLEMVFINCGTYTLEQQLKPVKEYALLQIGDVFVKSGSPGHAEIVVDVAVQKRSGKKIFLLAEGYMPAQDIHILLNPLHTRMGPWYELNEDQQLVTASWIFSKNQLRHW